MAFRSFAYFGIVLGLPYEIGADWVQRYFRVTENCARATQLKVQQEAAQSRQ